MGTENNAGEQEGKIDLEKVVGRVRGLSPDKVEPKDCAREFANAYAHIRMHTHSEERVGAKSNLLSIAREKYRAYAAQGKERGEMFAQEIERASPTFYDLFCLVLRDEEAAESRE